MGEGGVLVTFFDMTGDHTELLYSWVVTGAPVGALVVAHYRSNGDGVNHHFPPVAVGDGGLDLAPEVLPVGQPIEGWADVVNAMGELLATTPRVVTGY